MTRATWVALGAMAGGLGWGIRGQYGHETGAMIAGRGHVAHHQRASALGLAPAQGAQEPAVLPVGEGQRTLGHGDRLAQPVELGAQVGDKLVLRLDGSEVRVFTHDEALRRVQEMVGRYNQDGRLWSDELIAERRAEAARE